MTEETETDQGSVSWFAKRFAALGQEAADGTPDCESVELIVRINTNSRDEVLAAMLTFKPTPTEPADAGQPRSSEPDPGP